MKRILPASLFCMIVVLYFAARLWHLTDSCLWFDEIFSIHAARTDWNYFFSFIAQDLIHPPFFYLLLKFWLLCFGESFFAVRLFAVVFSVLAIIPFVLLCRELKLSLFEICIGLAALAVNGSLIKYAQEVRMYSLLLFLALTSIWLFMRRLRDVRNVSQSFLVTFRERNSILLFIVNLLLVYTHYFGWLIVFAELVAAVWTRKKVKENLLQLVFLLIAYVPWLYAIVRAWQNNRGLEQNLNGALRPDLQRIWEFIVSLHQPFYYSQSSVDASVLLIAVPVLLVCLSLLVFGYFQNRNNEQFQILAIFFSVPFLISFVVSWSLPVSVWGIRHLTIIFPAYFLLLALSFRFLSNSLKIIAVVGLSIFILIGGWLEFSHPKPIYIWCAWENLAADVSGEEVEKPVVYAFEDLVAYHLWFAANNKFQVVKINGYADMPEDKVYFLPRGFNDVRVANKELIGGNHFWLAFRQEKFIPDKQVLKDLQNQGYKIGRPFRFEAQGLTAFMIPVRKDDPKLSAP